RYSSSPFRCRDQGRVAWPQAIWFRDSGMSRYVRESAGRNAAKERPRSHRLVRVLCNFPPLKLAPLILLLLTAHTFAADPLSPVGFRPLFNGRDLTGWHGLNPHSVVKLEGEKKDAALQKMRDEFAEHWHVENGELMNAGTGPYATTDEEFGDIELRI